MSDKRIHILFFTTFLGGGGAEKHLLRVINHLDRDKFRISLALSSPGGSYESALAEDVKLYHLTTVSGTIALVRSVIPLRQLIKSQQPDILCSVMDNANIVAMLATKYLAKPPKTVLVVQVPPSIHNRRSKKWLVSRTVLSLIPPIYPQADKIVALSQGVAEDLKSLSSKIEPQIEIIYNAGVDEEVLEGAKESLPPDTLPQNIPVIVACGRLTEQKAFPDLIDALALVKKVLPVHLWIMGEGELRQQLESQIENLGLTDCVDLIGFHNNPYKYMAAADLFVLSSIYEGFGNVIVEAMACGTPVVSTDCPYGPNEIINNGVNGLLVPTRNVPAIAQAIIQVLTNQQLKENLSQNGKNRSEDFAAPKIASLYGKLFLTLL